MSRALHDLTKDELLETAREAGIEGRSDMTKPQLVAALVGYYGEGTPFTKDELMQQAQELEIEGRSDMNKGELAAAIAATEAPTPASAPAASGGWNPSLPASRLGERIAIARARVGRDSTGHLIS